jgi:4-carboxymuconolactone decarboxylase
MLTHLETKTSDNLRRLFRVIVSLREEIMKLSKPRIKPLKKNECTTEQLRLLNTLGPARNMNAFKTLVRHPRLFQRFLPPVVYILQESTLPPRDRELLILRIAWLCQAEYEWSHHSTSGKQTGLNDQEILRITKGPNAKGWTPFDAALLKAADELHKDTCISGSTWTTLAEKYTEHQLMDLIFTVGQYNLGSMVLNSLGVELEQNAKGFPSDASKNVKK